MQNNEYNRTVTASPAKSLSKWTFRMHSTVSGVIRYFVQSRGSPQNYCHTSTQSTLLSQCCCGAKLWSSQLRVYNKETLLALSCSACRSMTMSLVWSHITKSFISMTTQCKLQNKCSFVHVHIGKCLVGRGNCGEEALSGTLILRIIVEI